MRVAFRHSTLEPHAPRRSSRAVLVGAFFASLLAGSVGGQETQARRDRAEIGNDAVKVIYDLARGTFEVSDNGHARPIVFGARTEIEGLSSTDEGVRRSAAIAEVNDELGPGKTLTVRCSRPAGINLIAEFTVHGASDSAVVLRAGVENASRADFRVRSFRPLAGATVAPEQGWTRVRTLNGDSGAQLNFVAPNRFRDSANNLLLTYEAGGQRRSLVLGGLQVADFTRWARTESREGLTERTIALSQAMPTAKLVAYLGSAQHKSWPDCPVLSAVLGKQVEALAEPRDQPFASMLQRGGEVVVAASELDPHKRYAIGFSWWDYDAKGRTQVVKVRDSYAREQVVLPATPLPQYRGRGEPAAEFAAMLPADLYADGSTRVAFIQQAPGVKAAVSEVWLWEMGEHGDLPANWTRGHPVVPMEERTASDGPVFAAIEATDPLGKLVRAGTTYVPADTFYLDGGTEDPFAALEKYGRQLRAATGANPHPYDFPTVCAWFVGVWNNPEAQNHPERSTYQINTTAGLAHEMEVVRDRGFLRYSRVAVRLIPDTYEADNPQGWWDDLHWRAGGYFVPPFDSSLSYGQAIHDRGGLAFIYIQPTSSLVQISKDFREQHVNWLCGKDVNRALDYTLPEVQTHIRRVTAAMKGGIDGVMVDYADNFWRSEAAAGGFADPTVTSTAFYRLFFHLWKDGLGPDSWLHERNLFEPNNDLTLGCVDLQRTSFDTDKISPDLVSRSGLRWYKNRVVLNYDMDSKDLTGAWKSADFHGAERDGRRMALTMTYVASSRLLLPNSFRDLSAEVLHDLSRIVPFSREPRSARPIDAFVADGWPRVYDFAITPRWHQVVLYNEALPSKQADVELPLSGRPVDGALGLNPEREYYVYDFWNDHCVGRVRGSESLRQTLRPGEARMLAVHEVEPNPQFLSTNRHLMQGYEDFARIPVWAASTATLGGASKVVGGETYRVTIALNGREVAGASTAAAGTRVAVIKHGSRPDLAILEIDCPVTATVEWKVNFKK